MWPFSKKSSTPGRAKKKYELVIYAEAHSKWDLANLLSTASDYLKFGSGNGRYSDDRGFVEYQAKPVSGEIRDSELPNVIPYIRSEMQAWDDEQKEQEAKILVG